MYLAPAFATEPGGESPGAPGDGEDDVEDGVEDVVSGTTTGSPAISKPSMLSSLRSASRLRPTRLSSDSFLSVASSTVISEGGHLRKAEDFCAVR